jgi:hypothetical protein
MAQTIIVQLIDDLDGSHADETVSFALDGKSYEIELNKKNATALRKALAPYIEQARSAGKTPSPGRTRVSTAARHSGSITKTLYAGLDSEEKERFRAWAQMPAARRIADSRVRAWIESGRP